jgi:Protein  of unknown function (DUF3018)
VIQVDISKSFPQVLHVTEDFCKLLHVTNREVNMTSVNTRVQRHRDALRMAGLRPVQIWVPDTRQPNFSQECIRQSQLIAQADASDIELQHFMDQSLADIDGWTE